MSTRRRLLMAMCLKKPRLPREFQEVEYLESTGTQYIDTGVDFSATMDTTFDSVVGYWMHGLRQLMGANYGCFFGLTVNGYYETGSNAVSSVVGSINGYDKIHFFTDISNQRKTLIVNGITTSIYYNSWQSNRILLFSIGGLLGYYCRCRIKSFKIIQRQNVLRNFIPCYRKSDNVAGLYDLVNGVFYTNAGTGEFIVGGIVR